MDGKKQKKNFAEAIIKEANPIDHDLTELERLYDVAFDDSARAYSEFKKAAATTYGSLPGKDLLDRMIVSSSDTPFAKFMRLLVTQHPTGSVTVIPIMLVPPVGTVLTASRSYRQTLKTRLPPPLMLSTSRTSVTSVSSKQYTREKPLRSSGFSRQTPTKSCLQLI